MAFTVICVEGVNEWTEDTALGGSGVANSNSLSVKRQTVPLPGCWSGQNQCLEPCERLWLAMLASLVVQCKSAKFRMRMKSCLESSGRKTQNIELR